MGLEIIAFLAGFIGAVSTVPQIYQMIKTKQTMGISTQMFMMKNVAYVMWIAYGVMIASSAIVFWNIFAFAMSSAVVVAKYKIVSKQKALVDNIVEMDFSKDEVTEDAIAQKRHLRLVYSAKANHA